MAKKSDDSNIMKKEQSVENIVEKPLPEMEQFQQYQKALSEPEEEIKSTTPQNDAYIKDLESKVTELSTKHEQLLSLVSQMKQPVYQEPKEEEASWDDLFTENPKEAIKQLILNETKTVKESIAKEQNTKNVASYWDNIALKEYPDLADAKSDLYKETDKVIAEMARVNSDARKSPDLIYNAASRAYISLLKKGNISPERARDELVRRAKNSHGFIEGSRSGNSEDVVEITDLQKRIAARFGNTADIYKKSYAGGIRKS